MPDLGGAPGWIALMISGVTAYVSIRKVRVDERGGVAAELQELVKTLQNELERVRTRTRDRETELQGQIEGLRHDASAMHDACNEKLERLQMQLDVQLETTQRQANLITQLERRRVPRPEKDQ
jgi:ribosome recycling factor